MKFFKHEISTKQYRILICILLVLDIFAIAGYSYFDIKTETPDDYYVEIKETTAMKMQSVAEEKIVKEEAKLWGIFPVKEVRRHEVKKKKLAPSGQTAGMYLASRGMLVLGTTDLVKKGGGTIAPVKEKIRQGDVILSMNGDNIVSMEDFSEKLNQNKEKEAKFIVKRGNKQISIPLKPVLAEDGNYRLGVWLREDTKGIGTITYITEDGNFAALGHGISDVDTGTLFPVKEGELYGVSILSVKKGKKGDPGELEGVISMKKSNKIGNISKNIASGIYGKINRACRNRVANDFIDVAYKEEVKEGNAEIQIYEKGIKNRYEIEIEDVNLAGANGKDMIIKITDKGLLNKTGGIVQGLSGSPIIQDGKLIGAVTHVFVNDPTKGYGIFIENMLEQ